MFINRRVDQENESIHREGNLFRPEENEIMSNFRKIDRGHIVTIKVNENQKEKMSLLFLLGIYNS